MGGLQNGLINRSKIVLGVGEYRLDTVTDKNKYKKILSELDHNKVTYSKEYEIELMGNNGNRISPVILHGVDFKHFTPNFLKDKDTSGVIIGSDLASSLNAHFDAKINFISPAHIDYFIRAVPRQVSEKITDFYVSELSEVDSVHAWTRLTLVQNLIKERLLNRIVFYNKADLEKVKKIAHGFFDISFYTWEDKNKSLVWALNLETNVMLFLFIGMSFLVAICITSGFMIFFDKIKTDLISYWVLGKSQKSIYKMSYVFTHIVSFIFCMMGLCFGLLFLYLLQQNNLNFMPDLFVERNIPVHIDGLKVLISFAIPYLIAVVFSYFSFASFRKDTGDFIRVIRSVG